MNIISKFFLLLLVSFNAFAMVQVFPTKVVMNERSTVKSISVRNKDNKINSYSLKAVFFRMEKDGKMKMVENETSEERSLRKHIRFSPRRLSLKPGQEQVVRIMLKKVKGLPSGDYRAHLRILPDIPKVEGRMGGKDIKMVTKSRIAVSIGVIYYKGGIDMKAEISDFKIKKDEKLNKYVYSLALKNTGKNFLIGNMLIYYKNKNGEEELISQVKGVASYIEEKKVQYNIDFKDGELLDLTNGSFRVVYQNPKLLGTRTIASISTKL